MNNKTEKLCLTCKYYRLKNSQSGVCRVDRKNSSDYPAKKNENSCSRWLDCGQQYYIRVGWIKAQLAEE